MCHSQLQGRVFKESFGFAFNVFPRQVCLDAECAAMVVATRGFTKLGPVFTMCNLLLLHHVDMTTFQIKVCKLNAIGKTAQTLMSGRSNCYCCVGSVAAGSKAMEKIAAQSEAKAVPLSKTAAKKLRQKLRRAEEEQELLARAAQQEAEKVETALLAEESSPQLSGVLDLLPLYAEL